MTDHVHTHGHGPGGCGHTIDLPEMPLPPAPPPEDDPLPPAAQSPLRELLTDAEPPFHPVIEGAPWFVEYHNDQGDAFGIHKVIRDVVDARRRAVDRVLLAALTDGRYGVTVDDDGVRIDTDVPAGTIRYAPPGRKSLTGEWRADATLPAKTTRFVPPISHEQVRVGDAIKLERSAAVADPNAPASVGMTLHSMTARVWEAEGFLVVDSYLLDYLLSEGWRIVELVGER